MSLFHVDPWSVGLDGFDPATLGQQESVFALSNGHLGWRGVLDEGEPGAVPGSYLNGVFEEYEMPYAEEGYGYPECGQTVVDVTDGKVVRLMVGDDPLDLRTGTLHRHERRLDLRAGVLHRHLEWTSPGGQRVLVDSTRMVSLTRRALGAVRYRVEAVGSPVRIAVQSELVVNAQPSPEHPNPSVQDALVDPFATVSQSRMGARATLLHRTRASGLTVAVAVHHEVTGAGATSETEVGADLARTTVSAELAPGEHLLLTKFVGHEWTREDEAHALRDRADAAVIDAAREGWDALADEQRRFLDDYWVRSDIEVEGDPRLQQAVRFALFSLVQAAARAETRPIPGKGLTGRGYDGHTFWDSDAFVVPALVYTSPECARGNLLWRHATLEPARRRARDLSLAGAAYPWRTIDGREASGYWPASTAAFHINAAVAASVIRYVRATGDEEFERDAGLEILAETARLWMSLGRWDDEGRFHIDGVTGPDEYTAIVDDNVYTNLMAAQNLEEAAAAARRHPEQARRLRISDQEAGSWVSASDAMVVLYDERRGVHPQSAGFTDHEPWPFEEMRPDSYPLQSHFHYFDLYRKQVVKQADLVLALYLRPDSFTAEQKARDFAYYERLTVRDSSLSAAAQAVIAAEVGQLELAADYLAEMAGMDLEDLHHSTDGGLHIASVAGLWAGVVAGFGGMRHTTNGLRFAPRLPERLTRLVFRLRVRDCTIRVTVGRESVEYHLQEGGSCEFLHFGEPVDLRAGRDATLPIPQLRDPGPAPEQPRWRGPREVRERERR